MVPSAAAWALSMKRLVLDAVGDDEGALPAGVAQLLDERRGLGVVATEEERVGAGGRHLGDGGAEVGLLLLDGVVADDRRAEVAADDVGQALAVLGRVVDDEDLRRLDACP